MCNLHFTIALGNKRSKYHVGLSLVEFKEGEVTIIFSPALDLCGYGNTPDEAKKSFEIALCEFFRYTTNKNTLDEVLKEMEWEVKSSKKKPKYKPPIDSALVEKNEHFNDIVNNKDYKVSRGNLEFA